MPRFSDMNQLRAGAPFGAVPWRAPEKENPFAPAMVSQEATATGPHPGAARRQIGGCRANRT